MKEQRGALSSQWHESALLHQWVVQRVQMAALHSYVEYSEHIMIVDCIMLQRWFKKFLWTFGIFYYRENYKFSSLQVMSMSFKRIRFV